MSATDETSTQDHFQLENILKCSLPTSRVKRICRLDPELSMIANDAVLCITKATELFVAELAKASYTQAVLEKRKTIQTKDINRAIASKSMFDFLEDALTDWPKKEDVSQETMNLEESVAEEDNVAEDTEDPDDDDMQDVIADPLTTEDPDISQDDTTNLS